MVVAPLGRLGGSDGLRVGRVAFFSVGWMVILLSLWRERLLGDAETSDPPP